MTKAVFLFAFSLTFCMVVRCFCPFGTTNTHVELPVFNFPGPVPTNSLYQRFLMNPYNAEFYSYPYLIGTSPNGLTADIIDINFKNETSNTKVFNGTWLIRVREKLGNYKIDLAPFVKDAFAD